MFLQFSYSSFIAWSLIEDYQMLQSDRLKVWKIDVWPSDKIEGLEKMEMGGLRPRERERGNDRGRGREREH